MMRGGLLNTKGKQRYIASPSSLSVGERKATKYHIKISIKNTFDDLETILESDIPGHDSIKKYILERIGKISGTPVEQNNIQKEETEQEYEESDAEKDVWSQLD